jgi:hypothetical protein
VIVYIVEASRWGNNENHSYVLGCWDSLEVAKKAADEHVTYRGGKYLCTVLQCNLNNEIDSDWSKSVLYQV